MPYPIKRVAVVGATGLLGLPVTRALVTAGFEVTALARKPEQARGKLPSGVKVVMADVEKGETLVAALAGVDAVYDSLSITPDQTQDGFWTESKGMDAIIGACHAVGVPRIAYLSSLMQKNSHMDWWVLQMKRQAAQSLRQSGLDYSIFYPANFMESLPFRMRQGKRIVLAGRPRETSYWIAAKDYAVQVAAALHRAEAGINQEYTIQGPEKFRADEAAKTFVQNYTAEKLSVAGAPLAVFKLLGMVSPTMNYVRHISEALNTTPEPFDAERTWADLGKPPRNSPHSPMPCGPEAQRRRSASQHRLENPS